MRNVRTGRMWWDVKDDRAHVSDPHDFAPKE